MSTHKNLTDTSHPSAGNTDVRNWAKQELSPESDMDASGTVPSRKRAWVGSQGSKSRKAQRRYSMDGEAQETPSSGSKAPSKLPSTNLPDPDTALKLPIYNC